MWFFSPSDCFSVQFLRKSNFNFIDTYKIDVTESQSNQYSNQFVSITWNTFPWSFKSAFKRINYIEYRMWQLLFYRKIWINRPFSCCNSSIHQVIRECKFTWERNLVQNWILKMESDVTYTCDQETLSRHIGEGTYALDEQTDGQIIIGRDRDSFI